MDIRSSFNKFRIYFAQGDEYWRLCDRSSITVNTKTGPFFLNLSDRLEDGHYSRFDSEGFPVRYYNGEWYHNYTTICSYALAHWQRFLETGEESHSRQLIKTVEFLKRTGRRTDYGGLVFPFLERLSAMNQGEALSVVARAFEFFKDDSLVDFATDIIRAFEYPVEKYGVVGSFRGLSEVYWFEEIAAVPFRHILNGMIYSLVGLRDIMIAMPHVESAKSLFDNGIVYLESAIHLFDCDFWSWYWVGDETPNYIASAMYHNLHICQLDYLHSVTELPIFGYYAERFRSYSASSGNRLRAGFSLLKAKCGRR